MSRKKKHYISLQTGEIHQQPVANIYQFEIAVSPAEAARLQILLDLAKQDSDEHFFGQPVGDEEKPNRNDENIFPLYQAFYEFGDDMIKEHIEAIGVLQEPHD